MALDDKQAIRARIETDLVRGNIETPNVLSFNVSRSRKQMSATFSASIKIFPENLEGSTSGNSTIRIFAGEKGSLHKIFTGIVEKCVIQPVRSDASKIILNMSGRDTFSVMEGQKINRRLRTAGQDLERWGVVTSIKTKSITRREEFKEKIVDNVTQAIQNMPGNFIETTPDAFRLKTYINRGLPNGTVGGLEINKEVDTVGTTEEGG